MRSLRREGSKGMAGCDVKKEVVPFTAMAAVELATVGINTLYKAAKMKGLISYFVFMAYSYVIGTLLLLPFPFVFRRRELPPFQASVLCLAFLAAVIGVSFNICAYKGIEYSSPTLASAISNLTLAFTFVLAVIFRMEDLDWRNSTTRIKIIGTMLSVSGAFVAVLYKGPTILSSVLSSTSPSLSLRHTLGISEANWVIGGLLLVSQNFLGSLWYILLTQVMKMYPDEQVVTFLCLLFKTIISLPICFIEETKMSSWKLKPDIALVTILLSGFFGPAFSSWVHTWGLHLKGPLYISIFRPFSIAIAAGFGVIFLGDALCLGSVLGATILLVGFYAVIWGKAQEDTNNCTLSPNLGVSTDGNTPLLHSYGENMPNSTLK